MVADGHPLLEILTEAEGLCRELGLQEDLAACHNIRGVVLLRSGDCDGAVKWLKEIKLTRSAASGVGRCAGIGSA